MRIGIIVGSLSSTSINRKVATALKALAPAHVELVGLDLSALPLYSPDHDKAYPPAALAWKAAIEEVDGIIIVTPEYLRSIPAPLKNALEWASRPWGTNSLSGKPVAIMGASMGAIGTAVAQQHLRAILGHLNAPTMGQPETFLRFVPADYSDNGEVANDATRAVLERFVASAAEHVARHVTVPA